MDDEAKIALGACVLVGIGYNAGDGIISIENGARISALALGYARSKKINGLVAAVAEHPERSRLVEGALLSVLGGLKRENREEMLDALAAMLAKLLDNRNLTIRST